METDMSLILSDDKYLGIFQGSLLDKVSIEGIVGKDFKNREYMLGLGYVNNRPVIMKYHDFGDFNELYLIGKGVGSIKSVLAENGFIWDADGWYRNDVEILSVIRDLDVKFLDVKIDDEVSFEIDENTSRFIDILGEISKKLGFEVDKMLSKIKNDVKLLSDVQRFNHLSPV
jgi:hypothetical protein